MTPNMPNLNSPEEGSDLLASQRAITEALLGIRQGLSCLTVELPRYRRLAHELGMSVSLDLTSIRDTVNLLMEDTVPTDARFELVVRTTGAPILNEEGTPVRFKNRVKLLRSPRYKELLNGTPISEVCLRDCKTGQLTDHPLALGEIPGRSGGAASAETIQ